MIRTIHENDAAALCCIYNYYVEHTTITFEEKLLSKVDMLARIQSREKQLPWLVYEKNGDILGYAYACPWKTRSAYRFSVESTVYLSKDATGQGIGGRLYHELIARLKEIDVHCIIGGIALPNTASVALHEKLGFIKVAHFKEVGWKFERWIDVGYWELNI